MKLVAPEATRPFVKRGRKNDAADAAAICEAARRPEVKFVPVKTMEQQATLALHAARALLIKQQTMLSNALRGLAAEFGLTAPQGLVKLALQKLWGRRRGWSTIGAGSNRRSRPVPQPNDLSRSLVPFQQDDTLVAVIELSQSSWLVAGTVPGLERQPLKKLAVDEQALLRLLLRWRDKATKAGRTITRVAVAFEAGRDGFWLARWLRSRGIEAHVIHPASVAVSREHKRAGRRTGSTRRC